MIEKIWEVLTTFTEEAQQAGLAKCSELQLDPNRGVVSLHESYINLSAACSILKDAVEKRKLIQLPLTLQKNLLSLLEPIAKFHAGLIAGSDEVVNLTDAIEKLNIYIWQFGFHNLSDEVLGYQEKLNQLKKMELKASELKVELKKGITIKNRLEQISSTANEQINKIDAHVTNSAEIESQTKTILARVQEANQSVSALLTTTQQNETSSTQLLASTTKSNAEILALESQINTLVSGFTTLKVDLENNKNTLESLFNEFDGYRNTIDGLLGDANRTGMAAAFNSRRKWLIAPLIAWLFVFAFSIAGLLYMGAHYWASILDSAKLEQLPVRLALTAPFIWLGWFSVKQYGYTSRLREDYAYKTASAMSFEGYKREASNVKPEMLEKLLDTAIKNLGDNPIRIYNGLENHASPLHEVLEKSLKDEKLIDLLKAMFAKVRG